MNRKKSQELATTLSRQLATTLSRHSFSLYIIAPFNGKKKRKKIPKTFTTQCCTVTYTMVLGNFWAPMSLDNRYRMGGLCFLSFIFSLAYSMCPVQTADRTVKPQIKPTNEPPHHKTNKMAVRPAKTQISIGFRPV